MHKRSPKRVGQDDVPLSYVSILLQVFLEEGITMPELSEKLNISQASISRGIRKLSKYGDGGEIKGYDLVYATPDIEDRRRYAVFLTPKGEELRKKIDFGES